MDATKRNTVMSAASLCASLVAAILAIVALGMKTSFKGLLAVGWRPLALVLFESLFLGALVLAWVLVL